MNRTKGVSGMVEIVFRIGWFLLGWGAAFILLMVAGIGYQLYRELHR